METLTQCWNVYSSWFLIAVSPTSENSSFRIRSTIDWTARYVLRKSTGRRSRALSINIFVASIAR